MWSREPCAGAASGWAWDGVSTRGIRWGVVGACEFSTHLRVWHSLRGRRSLKLDDSERPLRLLFAGPSGVGKTAMAVAVCEARRGIVRLRHAGLGVGFQA
jgi:hypothetical protein